MILNYLVLATIPLDADGREIHTCYTYDTSVEYRPNIKQLLILLVPSNNSACDIFPAGVNINVTIGNTDFATTVPLPVYLPYSYTISNFGYQNTTQIAVEGFSLPLDGLGDEISIDFLLIEIYSYAEITRIEILEMQTIISSLSECFYSDMPMLVTKDSLYITMNSTGLCRIQIGALKSLQVTIEGKQFSFDLTQASLVDLKTNYNHNVKFNIQLLPGVSDSFAFTAEKPDISATAYLLTNQGGVDTRIDLQLSSSKYDSIQNFYQQSMLTLNDKSYTFTLIPKMPSIIALRAKLSATGLVYNKMILRIVMYVGSSSYTFEYLTPKYNPFKIHYSFSCSDMPSNQVEQCNAFYRLSAASSSGRITVSALFYLNEQMLAVQHDMIPFTPQYFERVYFELKSASQACLHLESTRPLNDVQTKFSLSVIRSDNYSSKGEFTFTAGYDNVQVCFDNESLIEAVKKEFICTLTVQQQLTVVHVFSEVKQTGVQKQNLARSVLISVLSAVVFVFSVLQLLRFQKQLKLLKKKKQ
ncbi:Conserved_hypothetical protein [Hexamita inflata]|uniref:Uncharacterized protein n=1 Tax=Hexamita inflata TaxID=28002 RepID=A0AA86Q3G6_9EUKA|nr:Conserved hypothetical protein [Hexamita inflata]